MASIYLKKKSSAQYISYDISVPFFKSVRDYSSTNLGYATIYFVGTIAETNINIIENQISSNPSDFDTISSGEFDAKFQDSLTYFQTPQ